MVQGLGRRNRNSFTLAGRGGGGGGGGGLSVLSGLLAFSFLLKVASAERQEMPGQHWSRLDFDLQGLELLRRVRAEAGLLVWLRKKVLGWGEKKGLAEKHTSLGPCCPGAPVAENNMAPSSHQPLPHFPKHINASEKVRPYRLHWSFFQICLISNVGRLKVQHHEMKRSCFLPASNVGVCLLVV